MPRNGTKNLDPVRSKDEAKKRGKKGGVKSGEARRVKKRIKDRLEILLSLDIKNDKIRDGLKELGIDESMFDYEMLLTYSLFQKALKGDVQAIKYIDERTGKSPMLDLKRREIELKEKVADVKEHNNELAVWAESVFEADDLDG